jgi:hypothetical protein
MNCNFTQMITVKCHDPAKLIELTEKWDINHASSDIVGYMGSRILADRQEPGRYICVVEFGVIDPDVSAAEEAARNNDRPETKAMIAAVTEIIDGDIEYHDFDEVYRTDQ